MWSAWNMLISELLISITSLKSPKSVHILSRVKKIENFPGNTTIHVANLFILNIQENGSMAGVTKSLYL